MNKARPFKKLNLSGRPDSEMLERARSFRDLMTSRRSVRQFSDKPVPPEIIEACIQCAGSAPSGANRQPWHFAVVSAESVKREIRLGAEAEEHKFYQRRAPEDWLEALAPLGTDADKLFLETAPYLVVIFAQKFSNDQSGRKQKNYYTLESVSIATGLLIAALHNAGLATLTHTPSPMKFLNRILSRPETEKPLLVLVIGHPAADARVPDIHRKALDDIASFHDSNNDT